MCLLRKLFFKELDHNHFHQGWHRSNRFIANQVPLIGPYFFIASTAYCEQVGVYLQVGGFRGEMQYW